MTSRAAKLGWYVRRLRSMESREVIHRVGEAAKRRVSRLPRAGWGRFAAPPGPLPCLAIEPHALAPYAELIRSGGRPIVPPPAGAGRYRALGYDFDISPTVDWHQDPASGLRWPDDRYCFAINYRHDSARGDVKLVWELNRLQFAPLIAALGAVDDDPVATETALALIESWIDSNPPFAGINWVSGIELAIRVVSILLVVGIVGPARVSAARTSKFAACLSAHAFWLARYPSRYSSANNHLVAEAAALFILGTLWPAHQNIDVETAAATLRREALCQLHPDGVGAEQSPTYTAFTCEWYLLAFETAVRAGSPFPREVVDRIGAAGDHLGWMMDEAGQLPRIGDDDEGRVIGSGAGYEPLYVASICGAIAAATGCDDPTAPPEARQWRNAVLGFRSAAAPLIASAPPNAPSPAAGLSRAGLRIFADGGYTVSRAPLSGRRAVLVLDHGPLGFLAIAAHGHADALSLLLHLDGSPVFVDAGTYLYHAGGPARERLRGTLAHNTPCVDGADQSEITGAFNWGRKARASLVSADPNDNRGVTLVAHHDGYVTNFGLACERAVAIDDGGFTIRDRFIPAGRPPRRKVGAVTIPFLIHPTLTAKREGDSVVVRRADETLLRLTGDEAWSFSLEAAEYSPAFGIIEDTIRIVYRGFDPSLGHSRIRIDVTPQNERAGEPSC